MVQGVSQQPSLRLSSQATTQINGFLVLLRVSKDHQLITLQNYLHLLLVIVLFTQSTETQMKICCYCKNGSIEVYDINGNQKSVVNPTGATAT